MKANTPNPTPTTLREILDKEFTKLKVKDISKDNSVVYEESKPFISQLNQATQSIQEQLKALLPKKVKWSAKIGYDFDQGYNQAINQIESAINNFCSGKGKEDE